MDAGVDTGVVGVAGVEETGGGVLLEAAGLVAAAAATAAVTASEGPALASENGEAAAGFSLLGASLLASSTANGESLLASCAGVAAPSKGDPPNPATGGS